MLRAYGVSDVGRVRKTNEDAFVSDVDLRLFAVADGMGGHKAGEVASRLAIDALTAFIRRTADDLESSWPFGIDQALSIDGNRLRTGIHLANRRVFRAAEASDDYSGMGATIVSLLVNGSRIAVAHVGDSRLYSFADGLLRQVTDDDSMAAVLAHESGLSPEEIARHPMRNVLTSVLGARDQVAVHSREWDLGRREILLLCSDGLHGAIDGDSIRRILAGARDVEAAARQLVETALDRGSRDNVTAVVVCHDAEP